MRDKVIALIHGDLSGGESLSKANGQKSAEAIVVAEMSDEGPNPCDCEMNQNAHLCP